MEYRHFGVMLDCSRNAVMKPEEVCRFIDHIALMGYNTLELYTEDTYEIPGEPFFGYLRGRYTKEEIRMMDAYGRKKGVELIPCVQTLAHNSAMCKHRCYYENIIDTGEILLCGDEKTYAFLDKVFATMADCYTSREINIGMDEAFAVGLGKYLQEHGYEDRVSILQKHLARVCQIADKYGFKPHMWSDMIFHLVKDAKDFEVPENIGLVFWDYCHREFEFYDERLTAHEAFNRDVWFAGGAWTWMGFAPYNLFSYPRNKASMQAVIKHGVQNVLITSWGDNGKECSTYSVLSSLYAARRFADGIEDMNVIKAGFKDLFHVDFDAFAEMDLPNALPGVDPEVSMQNPCKMFFYQDPLMGVFDVNAAEYPPIPYGEYAARIEKYVNMPEYGYLFDTLTKLCRVLEIKYDLGNRTHAAYKAGDKKALADIADNDYPEVMKRIENFYAAFRYQWMKENKPFGFEVQDARIGGLMLRMRSCRETILDYVKGKTVNIPELEETLLRYDRPYDNINGSYTAAISTSRV